MCLLLLTFWIRTQGTDTLPAGHFTETDAYFYYWQASLISEHGHLPARDMHRWLPVGRDLGQTLNLYGYVLAYTHKVLAWFFPKLSLYQVALYMPVVCFCIGLGGLCLFVYHTRGVLVSAGTGILLATLPGSIERSTAGFGDRDAFCLMLGILAVVTYLLSLQSQTPRKRFLWTLASGGLVFLGGISWEGFGVFLSVILIVELWRFLSTETEDGLGHYAFWVCCFVPTLYLVSPAYRSGYGFAEHLSAFVLLPPVVLLSIRALRYVLLSKVDVLRSHARPLSVAFTLACLTLAGGYVLIQRTTFVDTTVPLSQNAVMQAMTELADPRLGYWFFRYGGVFLIGSLGVIVAIQRQSRQTCLLIPVALFVATTFFREPIETFFSDAAWGTFLFSIALMCTGVGFLLSARLQRAHEPWHASSVAFLAWFILWVALSRDAKRYDFFIGVPLAFFTADVIDRFCNIGFLKGIRYPRALKTGIATALLTGILFLPPIGSHATRSLYAATEMRSPTPPENVTSAMRAMKASLPQPAIVAAHWAYGSQLNVIGGVKTIVDQDTYLQNWILLYTQHVHDATSETQVMAYLKTHGATHLMLTKKDPRDSFLRGNLSEAFRPVYPEADFDRAAVKVWSIDYPPDIKPNPKYLETGFPEIDTDLQLQ